MNDKNLKNGEFKFRNSKDAIARLKLKAKELGISGSELIRLRLENLPIRDNKMEIEFMKSMQLLFGELNHIGNNINQVTHAIHIAKKEERVSSVEFEKFTNLFKIYSERQLDLKNSIDKILYPENGI